MPRFSIVIPCYNASKTIPALLDCLRGQTFQDWEAFCMDDGSTDATVDILSQARSNDSRIVLLRQQNKGPAIARNRAAACASGQIIAFLDADDVWAPTKLAELDRHFRAPHAPDALYSKVAFFRDDSANPGAVSKVRPEPLTIRGLLGENPACTMSNIALTVQAWHRSGGLSSRMVHAEDLEWLIRLVGSGARVEGIDQVLTYYRANENGLSANLMAMHDGWAEAVRTAQTLDRTISQDDVDAGEAIHLRYLSRRALRTGQSPALALKLAARGFCRSPVGFLSSPRRGLSVLVGALAAQALPPAAREMCFQD